MPWGLLQGALSKESQASGETGRQNTKDKIQNTKYKTQNTKHKLQKRDIDAYELSYAQLGHKKWPFLLRLMVE